MIDKFRDELLTDTAEDHAAVTRNPEQKAQRRYLKGVGAQVGSS